MMFLHFKSVGQIGSPDGPGGLPLCCSCSACVIKHKLLVKIFLKEDIDGDT